MAAASRTSRPTARPWSGFAWGSTVSQPDGGQLLFLAGLQVAEAVRSTKVGKQLLDAFAEDGRAAGLTRMWMLSDAGHRAARLLYEDANDPPRLNDDRHTLVGSWMRVGYGAQRLAAAR
jgi:GNAT superfamily N-acetyltransferase